MGRLLANFILIKLDFPPLQYANRCEDRKKYIEKTFNKVISELTPIEYEFNYRKRTF